jgi:DNA-directed RNA polymerase specialized sigma24 family protein
VNESLLRELVPAVIGVLVRRGADFATAEDAMQEALIEAVGAWPDDPPREPKAWLVTVAWRKFLDLARADAARRRRAASERVASRNLRQATVTSQAFGSRGGSAGATRSASTSAACGASSAAAKSAPRRTRTPMTPGVRLRSRSSSTRPVTR